MTHVLILGVSGLIGHKLYEKLTARFETVSGTFHGTRDRFDHYNLFKTGELIENVEAADIEATLNTIALVNPDVILNCAGITKRRPEVKTPIQAITVNALFPHRLAQWAHENKKRVIHFSTDCVFDGATGNYDEESITTAQDAYGQTKALGELRYDHSLTIRSSFIGQELDIHSELLDWFLQQRGKTIKGFTQALYTGVSTIEMARVVGDIIENHTRLSGLYQLSVPEPISKYDLLCLARDAFNMDVEIIPDSSFEIKPTLNGDALRSKLGLTLPDWPEMMAGLAAESSLYKTLS